MSDLGLGPQRALRRSQRIVLRKSRLKQAGRWPLGHGMKGCAYLLKCRSTQSAFGRSSLLHMQERKLPSSHAQQAAVGGMRRLLIWR